MLVSLAVRTAAYRSLHFFWLLSGIVLGGICSSLLFLLDSFWSPCGLWDATSSSSVLYRDKIRVVPFIFPVGIHSSISSSGVLCSTPSSTCDLFWMSPLIFSDGSRRLSISFEGKYFSTTLKFADFQTSSFFSVNKDIILFRSYSTGNFYQSRLFSTDFDFCTFVTPRNFILI